MKIGFLGVGNMGSSILKGYISNENSKNDEFIIFNRTKEKAEAIKKQIEFNNLTTNIKIAESKEELVEKSDIFFIGVKPKDYEDVLTQIASVYRKEKICVSMAAGISISYIKSFLGKESKVIRIMPNTPAKIGCGATSISAGEGVSNEELSRVEEIMSSIGVCVEVDEKHIHSVIGASGSSPAYTYMYMDALIKEAVENGLSENVAKKLVANTVIGAAKMLLEEKVEPQVLIDAVSSPGGTTVAALDKLREKNFEDTIREGFKAAVRRSKEMEK